MAKTQDENLITFLLGDASIAQAVGARVFFNHAGGEEFPRIVFTRVGTSRDGAIDDAAGAAPNRETFRLEIRDPNPRKVEDLRKLVEARLNCYRSTFGDTTVAGIFAEDESSAHESYGAGDEQGLAAAYINAELVFA